MNRIVIALVALLLLTGGGYRRDKPSQPSQEQSVKTSSDTSNTNIAVPPAPLAEPSYSEVLFACGVDTKVGKKLCKWGLDEIEQRRSPHVCTSWPLWINKWPFLRHYC